MRALSNMPKSLKRSCPLFLLALLLPALGLSACASSEKGRTVATVGATKVSQATLGHWMTVTLGGDYRPIFRADFPEGLVSDPPDYGRCVSAAERIPRIPGKPKLTASQMRIKCRQLHAAIADQALNLVLSGVWLREEAGELGIRRPSEGEISSRLRAYITNDYKSSAQFREVIADQHRSLGDVRYMIESSLLESSIHGRLEASAARLGGASKAAYYKLVLGDNAKWQARTSCSSGYRSSRCKEYAPGSEVNPPASLVLEYFRKGIG